MATTTFHEYTGDGSDKTFDYSFPTYVVGEVVVEVDGVLVNNYTVPSYATTGTRTVTFDNTTGTTNTNVCESDGSPKNGLLVRIRRDTGVDTAKATYAAGSAIKAEDLNANQTQILRALQEEQSTTISTTQIRDAAITSAKIKDGTIVNGDINASAAIAGTKVTPSFGSQNVSTTGTAATGALTVTGAIAVSSTVDGRDVAADGTKLDGIETAATADQTASEIRTLVESASDSNVFTDADHSKLNAIEASATGDQNAAEIRALVEAASDSNVFTDADHTKVNAAATLTGSETLTNKTLTTPVINDMSGTAVVTSGTSTSDNKVYSAKRADEKYYQKGSADDIEASGVPWSGNDSTVATTAAIDKRIVDIVDDVGGFVPLTDEGEIPQYHPEKENTDTADRVGTILSIGTLTTTYTPSTGTCTIQASDLTNHAVNATITDCGSTVLSAGFGVLVETKAQTDAQYAAGPSFKFHRLVPKATEVTTVAGKATEIGRLGTAAAVEDLGILGTTAVVSDLDTLADISSNITTVAGVSSNVTTVAGISSDVTTVASNNSNVTAVGGKATEIGRLGTADAVADLALLGTTAVVEDLNLLGTSAVVADMALLGDSAVIADMATIADTSNLITNIGTVAGIQANVTTVAGNSSNVTTVASNMSTVNDFAARYRAATNNAGEYSSNNDTGDLYFNTDINAIKVWNGSAWVAGVTDTGDYAVTTGNTYTGNLKLNDSVELRVGTGDDLKIYHSGTQSYIKHAGTGNLYVDVGVNEIFAITMAESETLASFSSNGAVELFYDGSKKLETTSYGAYATGTFAASGDINIANDTGKVQLGASNDLQIYHDATDSYIQNDTGVLRINNDGTDLVISTDSNIHLRTNGTEEAVKCIADGAAELYYDNSRKLRTTATGGILSGSWSLTDNNKMLFGTGDDLQIYHDGTDTYIDNDTNVLFIQSDVLLLEATNGENFIKATANGSVELYYNSAKKFETTSGGAKVTGDLDVTGNIDVADNVRIKLGTGDDMSIWHDGTTTKFSDSGPVLFYSTSFTVQSPGAENIIVATQDGAVELYYDNSKKFETTSGGINVTGTTTDDGATHDGDVTFTGASYNVTWDKSADDLIFYDNAKAVFGTSSDLQIYHDTSDSYIWDTGAGNLYIGSVDGNVEIQLNSSEYAVKCVENGTVELYYDAVKKLETTSYGVKAQGALSVHAAEGATAFIELVADEGDDNADYWKFESNSNNNLSIQNYDSGSWENAILARPQGAVELYHDNNKKVETTSTGATVTGRLLTDATSIGTTIAGPVLTINSDSNTNAVSIRNTTGGNGNVGILFSTQNHSGGREKAAIYHAETHGQAHYGGDIAFCLNTATGSATQVSLSDRKATITRHGGICFNSDTADANALDDYEEGTWTPTVTATGTDPSITYAHQQGKYTKIGRTVFIECFIDILAGNFGTGGSGDGTISGLPFTSNSQNDINPGGFADSYKLVPNNFSTSRNNAMLFLGNNTTVINVNQYNSDTTVHQTGWGISQMDNGDRFKWQFWGTYQT